MTKKIEQEKSVDRQAIQIVKVVWLKFQMSNKFLNMIQKINKTQVIENNKALNQEIEKELKRLNFNLN